MAFAANEFTISRLLENPHRVGTRLRPPLEDCHSARRGTYRLPYRIDGTSRLVTVLAVVPRADAYRAHRRTPASQADPSTGIAVVRSGEWEAGVPWPLTSVRP